MAIQDLITDYLDMEGYGANLIIKKYCHFPLFLPLPAHLEHGWTGMENAIVSDLKGASGKGFMLVYSKRRQQAWKKASKIPVLTMGSPFMLFRRMNKINCSVDAKGTVAFPSHSTLFLESQFNIDEYCLTLKKLPAKFHPITVCLLYPDIKLGRDKVYLKHGFEVVSAGKKLRGSLNFVRNFYSILSKYKYSTSNEVGSYSFYAVELGIPFFLLGEEPTIFNKDNKDPNSKERSKLSDYPSGRGAIQLFAGKDREKISSAQKDFVLEELGIPDMVGSKKLKTALFKNTHSVNYYFVRVPMFFLMSLAKRIMPTELAYLIFKKLNKGK